MWKIKFWKLNCFFYFRRGQISSNLYRKKRWHFKKGHAKKRNKGNRRRSTALSLFFLFFFFFYYYLYCLIRVKIKILKIGPRSAKPSQGQKRTRPNFIQFWKMLLLNFVFWSTRLLTVTFFERRTLCPLSSSRPLRLMLCVCVVLVRHTAFFDRRWLSGGARVVCLPFDFLWSFWVLAKHN